MTQPPCQAAREEAISYAAYRVLGHRYGGAQGGKASLREFAGSWVPCATPWDAPPSRAPRPAALGNRIADTIIRTTDSRTAPASERDYTSGYQPVNDPLIVERPGIRHERPQPLAAAGAGGLQYTQNGLPLPVGPQQAVTTHWGNVTAFALPPSAEPGLPSIRARRRCWATRSRDQASSRTVPRCGVIRL